MKATAVKNTERSSPKKTSSTESHFAKRVRLDEKQQEQQRQQANRSNTFKAARIGPDDNRRYSFSIAYGDQGRMDQYCVRRSVIGEVVHCSWAAALHFLIFSPHKLFEPIK
jgi:hypothetical protein